MGSNCSKCRSRRRGSSGKLSSHFAVNPNLELEFATVAFDADRVLCSETNFRCVRVAPKNGSVDVYLRDLAYWIQHGVSGITFIHAKEEANFLAKYPSIRQKDYA